MRPRPPRTRAMTTTAGKGSKSQNLIVPIHNSLDGDKWVPFGEAPPVMSSATIRHQSRQFAALRRSLHPSGRLPSTGPSIEGAARGI